MAQQKRPQSDLLTTSSTSAALATEDPYFKLSNGIEISLSDEREFLSLTLPNGLRALVVSDKDCDKAGAGLCVNVGHFSDEDELPGLAHFLEHMVFMGSAKFPDENDYSAFLSKSGGSSSKFYVRMLLGL
jgi:insulysin